MRNYLLFIFSIFSFISVFAGLFQDLVEPIFSTIFKEDIILVESMNKNDFPMHIDLIRNGDSYIKWSESYSLNNQTEKTIYIKNIEFNFKENDIHISSEKKPFYSIFENASDMLNSPYDPSSLYNIYPIAIPPNGGRYITLFFDISVYINGKKIKLKTLSKHKYSEYVNNINISKYFGYKGNEINVKKIKYFLGFEIKKENSIINEKHVFNEEIPFPGKKSPDGGFYQYTRESNFPTKRMGDVPVTVLKESISKYPHVPNSIKTIDGLYRFLSNNQSNINSYLFLSTKLFFKRNLSEGEKILNSYFTEDRVEKSIILNNIGVFRFENKKYTQGLEYFEKSILLDTCNVEAYINIYEYYLFKKNNKGMVNIIKKSIDFCNKEIIDISYLIFLNRMHFKNFNEALIYLHKLENKNLSNGKIYHIIALMHSSKKQYNKAIKYYKKSINFNFEEKYLSLSNLASIYIDMGDLNSAKKYIIQSININNYYYSSHYKLAYLYTLEGDFSNAIIQYDKCIKINSQDSSAYIELIDLYKNNKDYKMANKVKEKLERIEIINKK